jgi:GNAT superfamily N-acetyltransferase
LGASISTCEKTCKRIKKEGKKVVEYRLLKLHEYEQAIVLADKTFRDLEHISMGKAFPHVFSTSLNQSYGVFVNGELVSFIGLVPSVIHIESAEVQAYSIGAVCTHPDYRNKGYASALLKKVFNHIRRAEGSILFVSGTLPMYQKEGCTFFGELNKYDIKKGELQKEDEYSIREVLPHDWFHIRKLSHSRKVRFEQSIFDLAFLHQAEGFVSIHKMSHKILVAEGKGGIKAFLVLGVPYRITSDSQSRVIEWAGDPRAIKALLAESLRYDINSIMLSLPSYEVELIELFNLFKKTVTPFPGTIKLMELNLLLKQLNPYFKGKIDIIDIDEQHKKLIYNRKSTIVTNVTLKKFLLQGTGESDEYLKDIFPIPFPYSEGLNYV